MKIPPIHYYWMDKFEWAGHRRGPPTTMGSMDGTLFPACPICGGVQPETRWQGSFYPIDIGHRAHCELVEACSPTIEPLG